MFRFIHFLVIVYNLPVTTRNQAIEKLDWYAMRWKIETFHKILKSGCRAEESRLWTADRLVNLISLLGSSPVGGKPLGQ